MAWVYVAPSTGDDITQAMLQAIQTDLQRLGGNLDAAAYGITNGGFFVLNPGELPGLVTHTITAASYNTGTGIATFTLSAAHNVAVNQFVTVTGVTPSGYNGTMMQVTATPTSSEVSVAISSNPGTYTSGGSLVVGPTPITGMFAINQNGALYTYFSGAWSAGGGTITTLGQITTYEGITTAGALGMPVVVAAVGLTAQGANVSSTNLLASTPVAGIYRVTIYETVTRAATTSSTLPSVSIGYTDKDTSQAISGVVAASSGGNSLTTITRGELILHVNSGTAITYSTSGFATSGATSMQYALHIRLECIG